MRRLAVALVALSPLAACSGSDAEGPVRLVTYSSFPSEGTGVNDALAAFTADTGIEVEIVVAGDTGTMVAKAALTAGNPEGDVMWGVDNTFLSRAVEAGVFEAYRSPALDVIDPSLVDLVPDDLVTPVDFGDVCVNYDIDALTEAGVVPPVDFEDLADPAYRGLLAVQDPASSSPGLAFLIGTVVTFGDDWPAYWESLVANDVLVTDDWEEAYYGAFTRAGGDRPLVVSYGSSPPYEVLFDPDRDSPPTGVAEDTCTRQVEFAGVLRGTERPDAARALIDFLVSADFQRHVANDLYVFPVDPSVELDPLFTEFAVVPADSVVADPARVEASRSDWLERWADVVGR